MCSFSEKDFTAAFLGEQTKIHPRNLIWILKNDSFGKCISGFKRCHPVYSDPKIMSCFQKKKTFPRSDQFQTASPKKMGLPVVKITLWDQLT